MTELRQIRDLLMRYKKIAVVGISPNPMRASHGVSAYMLKQGYQVVGVNPAETEVLGQPCYPSLKDVPGDLEIVDVFRAPEFVPAIVDEAIKLKAKVLWLQEGVTHPEAEKKAKAAGILVISDRCILKDHSALVG